MTDQISPRELNQLWRKLELFDSKQDGLADSMARIETMVKSQSGTVSSILEQAKATNGRVTKLERTWDKFKGYVGGIMMMAALISAVVSLVLKIVV